MPLLDDRARDRRSGLAGQCKLRMTQGVLLVDRVHKSSDESSSESCSCLLFGDLLYLYKRFFQTKKVLNYVRMKKHEWSRRCVGARNHIDLGSFSCWGAAKKILQGVSGETKCVPVPIGPIGGLSLLFDLQRVFP